MSFEQSTEVAAGARRRIVALPVRIEAPVALIMRDAEQREQLAEQLGRRRVVSFPSLAHFCTDEQRRQPWVGIIVGYSCAWDAQLDRYIAHRSCISLFLGEEQEGYGWPDAVSRIADRTQLDAWLADLLEPMPAWKRALEEAKNKKKERKPRGRPARVQLSLPMLDTQDLGSPKQSARPQPSEKTKAVSLPKAPKAPKQSKTRVAQPKKAVVRSEVQKGKKKTQSVARGKQEALRYEAPARPVVRLSAREIEAASRAGAHLSRDLSRLALELGLVRARELLQGLEQNVRAYRKGR